MKVTWLADVLRNAGLKVVEVEGWEKRTRGTLKDVEGIILHHTAGSRDGNAPSLEAVKNGRPGLTGPLAQMLLARDGTFYIVAAGRANHAGHGKYVWGKTTVVSGNNYLIGIEGENTGLPNDLPWPKVQYDAYVKGVAAILDYLHLPTDRVIGHKEWTNRKIDPSFDMGKFREDVDKVRVHEDLSPVPEKEAPMPELHAEQVIVPIEPIPVEPKPNLSETVANKLSGKDRPMYARDLLISLGWTKIQAAALIGDAMVESGEDLNTGEKGIMKWYTARMDLLKEFAAQRNTEYTDLDTQVRFIDWELRNTEKYTFNELKKATDVMSAVRAAVSYNRPSKWTKDSPESSSKWSDRVVYAFSLI